MSAHRRILLVGLFVWAPLALATTACDSDSVTADSQADGSPDSTAGGDADSSSGEEAATVDGSAEASSSARCYPVAQLPTPSAADAAGFGSAFCPFLADASTHAEHFCATGDHCCEGPLGTWSSCTANTEACAVDSGGIDWWCQYPGAGQCGADQVCCAIGTLVLSASADAGDGGCGNYVHGFKSTSCVAASACPSGQIQMCASDLDCPTGQHCYAFQAGDIKELGGCQ
jgi:hypothetical protein